MAGVYAAIGGLLLVVIAQTLLREGRQAGWWALLFVLLAGGTLELVMNGPLGILFQHGLNPIESIPQGTVLFGYLFAWMAALVISWRPSFRPGQTHVDLDPGVVTAGHSGAADRPPPCRPNARQAVSTVLALPADSYGGLAGPQQSGPPDTTDAREGDST
jgi:hypothetical protein